MMPPTIATDNDEGIQGTQPLKLDFNSSEEGASAAT